MPEKKINESAGLSSRVDWDALEAVARLGGTRVLIVEDDVDAAESLKMLLEIFGHTVHVVDDGLAAIGAARRFRPDVMLVDVGLPGMNGYEVARQIRTEPALRQIVLAAVTGYGGPQARERAHAAGFDRHFRKPLELSDLGLVFADHAARNAATKDFQVSSPSPARIGK